MSLWLIPSPIADVVSRIKEGGYDISGAGSHYWGEQARRKLRKTALNDH